VSADGFGFVLLVMGAIVGIGGPFLSGGKDHGASFNWYVWGFLTMCAGAAIIYYG
jgi:hypothetical protein